MWLCISVVLLLILFTFLQIGLVAGVFLAAVLGVSFSSLATLFTKDAEVLGIVRTGVLVSVIISLIFTELNVGLSMFSNVILLLQFVSASQPINALAFIFDGLHYGVSDFKYAACSMVCDYVYDSS